MGIIIPIQYLCNLILNSLFRNTHKKIPPNKMEMLENIPNIEKDTNLYIIGKFVIIFIIITIIRAFSDK